MTAEIKPFAHFRHSWKSSTDNSGMDHIHAMTPISAPVAFLSPDPKSAALSLRLPTQDVDLELWLPDTGCKSVSVVNVRTMLRVCGVRRADSL